MKKVMIKKDSYFDSVFLMLASKAAKEIQGVVEVAAVMGTKANIDLLENINFETALFKDVRPNDLIISVAAESNEMIKNAFDVVNAFLNKKEAVGAGQEAYQPVSLQNAIRFCPQSNLVLISVPGPYAAREARLALKNDKHVMLFSDNVSIQDEIELKTIALDRGLLMMGPDCGTAIINGAPLCFANQVSRGDIGLVAASGSGLQEVSCCIHKMGAGISQALGTGGRDMKSLEIGGMMMKTGIHALALDESTNVIVVISKPPAKPVAESVLSLLKETGKPCVVCFLGQRRNPLDENIQFAESLEETACLAVQLSKNSGKSKVASALSADRITRMATRQANQMNNRQKYIRGLYTGGTLADEAIFGLEWKGFDIYSNIQLDKALMLKDPGISENHTIIDLGDDGFTVGRPHPMIDPSIRKERLDIEIKDPETAVILMDFVLGNGAHKNPVGQMMDSIINARKLDEEMGRHIAIIASITGTDKDFQDMHEQIRMLKSQDCIVMPSNFQAGLLASAIIKELE